MTDLTKAKASALKGRRILLIIAGGIAAFKSLDLIRRLREQGAAVRCVLTKGGAEFITPLSVASLSGDKVYTELFSLTDEAEMGHIRLSREADLVVVAPATAHILARMAAGLADDLASAALLAADKPILAAPAMNAAMWGNKATEANIATLKARGVEFVGPASGDLACGEVGEGRLADVAEILDAIASHFSRSSRRGLLAGRRALVTAGPTYEAIDPVRYIANRSSGKQGYAVAEALAELGAETILVAGPTSLPDPGGLTTVHVESAREMLAACERALPVDIAVCAAAVADWRPEKAGKAKVKKNGGAPPGLSLVENPDILAALSARRKGRPRLMIGFAAETEALVANAKKKRAAKGCDWILANDVSLGTSTFGGERNAITFITEGSAESWPEATKTDVARRLAARIAEALGSKQAG